MRRYGQFTIVVRWCEIVWLDGVELYGWMVWDYMGVWLDGVGLYGCMVGWGGIVWGVWLDGVGLYGVYGWMV